MITTALAVLAGFAFAACGVQPQASVGTASASHSVQTALAAIDTAGTRHRIDVIAHDSMGGRATPSRGLDLTARYIASEFERFGLEPALPDGFIQTYSQNDDGTAPNVAGILPGSDADLRDTYVVYSAHMDHLGTGPPDASGDSIYNGADDDASGTAAVIEIAEAFSLLDPRPARSIVFLTVSGEEGGLLGSEAFVAHGPIPPAAMVANINIDMIGRNSPDTLVAIGKPYSTLGTRVDEIASAHPSLGLVVVDDLWPDERFFFRSDHFTFAGAGVPALFFFAGVHEDYHRPSDEVERIDADKAARIARLAFLIGLSVANAADPPDWTARGRRDVLGTGGS
jgi:hypothetical protein